MKKIIKLLIAMVLLALSINVSAIPIATVGMKDTKIAQTSLANSGAGTEETWVESILGVPVTYTQLSGSVSDDSNWEAVTGGAAGDFAFNLGAAPTHFLVKVGGGGGTGTSNTHFLYNNLGTCTK